jgi:hypothetical protein
MEKIKRQYLKENKLQEEIYPEDYIEVGEYLKDVKYGHGYVTLEKVKMDIENAPYNFTLADVLKVAGRYGFEIEELASGTALVQKGASINEELTKMSKEDQGCSDKPAYASAVRDLEETEKAKEEYREIPEAEKVEEKPKMPKMVAGAKKMHLDESLFEDNEGDVKSKVKAFLKDQLSEFNDNLAFVVHASIPEYNPDLCAEDAFDASMYELDKAELNYINALVNVLFANEAK